MDIRHHDSVNARKGAINGILFKTTNGDPLGLDTFCDPSASSVGGTTTSNFDLGLGFLGIEGFHAGNWNWARITDVHEIPLIVNTYRDENNIDIHYDPDRIKLLGTQG